MVRKARRGASEVTLDDLLRSEVRRRCERLATLDPLSGGSHEVHDTRVALRRIRATLRTYRGAFDPSWAAEASAAFGWWANQLDGLRDADVRLARLGPALDKLTRRGFEPEPAARLALESLLADDRAVAHEAALDACAAPRAALARKLLDQLAEAPPLTARAAQPVGAILPRLIERPWRDLRAAAGRARATLSDPDLHVMRIRAKQLRYSAELVGPAAGAALPRLARAAESMQTALGEHRDASECSEWLRGRAGLPDVAFLAGQLFSLERRAATGALTNLDDDWRALRRQWRRWRAESQR